MVKALLDRGWVKFPAEPTLRDWAAAALPLARERVRDPAERAKWLQCEGTWFVGVDALPNDGPARKRVEGLVAGNLNGGRVEVAIQNRDGLEYIVSRSAGESPVVLDANRAPTEINLRSGGLFNVDIFSQNEVEERASPCSRITQSAACAEAGAIRVIRVIRVRTMRRISDR